MLESRHTEATNLLQDLHQRMINLPLIFRERVCVECNWSLPTFYRKMRPAARTIKGVQVMVTPQLSNAEKEKIIAVSDEVNDEFRDYCEQYRKKSGKS